MATEQLKKIDAGFLKNGAASVSMDDLGKILEREEEIREKAKKGKLAQYVDDIKVLCSMVRDYFNGSYREVPWYIIAAIAFALLYVLSPIDLIPDAIPVAGLIDDAAVVGLCLALAREEIEKYRSSRAA